MPNFVFFQIYVGNGTNKHISSQLEKNVKKTYTFAY